MAAPSPVLTTPALVPMVTVRGPAASPASAAGVSSSSPALPARADCSRRMANRCCSARVAAPSARSRTRCVPGCGRLSGFCASQLTVLSPIRGARRTADCSSAARIAARTRRVRSSRRPSPRATASTAVIRAAVIASVTRIARKARIYRHAGANAPTLARAAVGQRSPGTAASGRQRRKSDRGIRHSHYFRTATALFPHWNRITSALEPYAIPGGIEAWKSQPPKKAGKPAVGAIRKG